MDNKIKTIIFVLVFAVLVGGSYFAYQKLSSEVSAPTNLKNDNKDESVSEQPKDSTQSTASTESSESDKSVPKKAPEFTVYDAQGNVVKLSDFVGKPTVVNFWASWCPPCKKEMPDFDKIYNEMGEEVNFLMVDLVDGSRETQEIGQNFIDEQGYTFPIYFDNDQNAAETYGIMSIPTTIFVDKDGYLITGAQGMITEEQLRLGIKMAMESK